MSMRQDIPHVEYLTAFYSSHKPAQVLLREVTHVRKERWNSLKAKPAERIKQRHDVLVLIYHRPAECDESESKKDQNVYFF